MVELGITLFYLDGSVWFISKIHITARTTTTESDSVLSHQPCSHRQI